MESLTRPIPQDLLPREFDPRTKSWIIVQPWFLGGMLILYWAVCRYLKNYMATRDAFNIKPFMIIYNLAMILLSAYMFYELVLPPLQLGNKFSLLCQPVYSGSDEVDNRFIAVTWWYYFSKFIEFFDTWFMLSRRKFKQVSFLHLYHHSSIAAMSWYTVVFCPGGQSFFAPLLNSFVHTVMYSYYLLTICGVDQKYLWWKKYITKLQLTQFVLILCHSCLGFFMGCGFPRHYMLLLFFYNVSMYWLFTDFYTKSYKTNKSV